ncbi:MAG: hypothetical protein E3J72_16300 [Planctomycetota bacterium]|nr:MAG: hypothetical protein E3J72_16300 [Planctomycetota bacterium]
MARKKAAKKKQSKKKTAKSRGKKKRSSSPGRVRRFFGATTEAYVALWRCAPLRHLVIGAAIVTTMLILFCGMQRQVEKMPRFQVRFSSLDLYSEQDFSWIKGRDMRRLLRVPLSPNGRSVFDPKLLKDVREAFLSNPWVSSVDMVRREYPNTVTFQVRLRRPVAYIRQSRKLFLVDGDGFRLPGTYFRPVPELKLPFVSGASESSPAPPIGMAFDNPRLAPALDLVAIMDSYRWLLDKYNEYIEEIDVSNVGSTEGSEVNFRLSSGMVFEWGRTPGSGNLPVLTTKQKIENLKRALETRNRPPGRRTVSLWSCSTSGQGNRITR